MYKYAKILRDTLLERMPQQWLSLILVCYVAHTAKCLTYLLNSADVTQIWWRHLRKHLQILATFFYQTFFYIFPAFFYVFNVFLFLSNVYLHLWLAEGALYLIAGGRWREHLVWYKSIVSITRRRRRRGPATAAACGHVGVLRCRHSVIIITVISLRPPTATTTSPAGLGS